MKGITCVDFDMAQQTLYLIRQQISSDPTEECCIYRFDLQEHLNQPQHSVQSIEDVAVVVA